jgi:NAD(P)-dependent dehydrogenase (short-subunit alcohol dehydrogenase family)
VVYEVKRYSLSDKVVLITGAGRGLGAATATALTQRGARVVLADVDLCAAHRVAGTLPNGQGLAVKCDVTQSDSVEAAVRRTYEEFGRIDVAIANARILGRGAHSAHSRPTKWAVSCPSTWLESSTRWQPRWNR